MTSTHDKLLPDTSAEFLPNVDRRRASRCTPRVKSSTVKLIATGMSVRVIPVPLPPLLPRVILGPSKFGAMNSDPAAARYNTRPADWTTWRAAWCEARGIESDAAKS